MHNSYMRGYKIYFVEHIEKSLSSGILIGNGIKSIKYNSWFTESPHIHSFEKLLNEVERDLSVFANFCVGLVLTNVNSAWA